MSVTFDADLEPRPLPSTGVTRLRRYYGPLRHPKRPGLSLAGVRLRVTPLTAWASRVAFDLRLPTCRRQYPGGPLDLDRSWDGLFQPFPCIQRRRPSPNWGWIGVHIGRFEACSTFTGYYGLSARCIAYSDTFVSKAPTDSFPPRVASVATGWSDPVAGWESHPLKINT